MNTPTIPTLRRNRDSPNTTKKQCPPISLKLIEFLEDSFKPDFLRPDITDRQLWTEYGKRQVVKLLRSKYDAQHRELLNDHS